MLIDEAIEFLGGLKSSGTKSVVMITMTAENFNMEDDEEWAHLASLGESDMRVLDEVSDGIESIKEEEGCGEYANECDDECDD